MFTIVVERRSRRVFAHRVVILVVTDMTKILMLTLIVPTVMNCYQGNTQRTRCKFDLENSQNQEDPQSCLLYLPLFQSSKNPKINTEACNLMLLNCLRYTYQMTKCGKNPLVIHTFQLSLFLKINFWYWCSSKGHDFYN